MTLISVVSPVYRAESILPELIDRITHSVNKITEDFEIILVEDASPDQSWNVIEHQATIKPFIKGIKFSRNFGQHAAITAGLDHAIGDWIVVMDCDLQDLPEEIINLYKKAQDGFDLVLARRHKRQDGFIKSLFSKMFHMTLSYLTGTEQDETIANFGIYSRKAIHSINAMREPIRCFPTMIQWIGFKSTKLNVKHSQRFHGTSSYNFRKRINLALDVFLATSDKPIRLLFKSGLTIALFSFVAAVFIFALWLKDGVIVAGYASLIISIWFLSGFMIAILGIVGLYVGKIFEGVKKRPIYLIEKTIND